MARPIKETPILHGKDAKEFERKVAENLKKKIPQETIDRINASYERVSKIAKLP